ncbi:hypothetical protein MXB_4548 [Myxobolus squamalis]|nr:hypothetical protein MXB_4548 [Myxobolus squamalis]
MCQFDIALKCYRIIKDIPALFLLAFSLNNRDILNEVLKLSIEQKNIYVSFIIYYITGNINDAIQLLKNNHLEAESAIMSYCYAPHLLEDTFNHWNSVLKVSYPKEAEKLADPFKYPNLFPHLVHSTDICDEEA